MFLLRRLSLTILSISTMLDLSQSAKLSANMSRFKSIVEEDTCFKSAQWLRYDQIGSLFFTGPFLHLFCDRSDTNVFHWAYWQHNDLDIKPIYNLRLEADYAERYMLKQSEHQLLYKEFLKKYRTTFYYVYDRDRLLFVFEDKQSKLKDIVLVYNLEKKGGRRMMEAEGFIAKGTIPLLHTFTEDIILLDIYVPISLINNREYTYQTGWLMIEPLLTINMSHTSYYYGFTESLDKIYFAQKFQQLEQIPKFLHPKTVVNVERWHPFRCYGYVYLQVDDWVFIFPHLNLTEQLHKLNYPPILQASMTVMHLNTLFRCSNNDSNISIPTYPSPEIVAYSLPTFAMIKPTKTVPQSRTASDAPNNFVVVLKILAFFILFLPVILICFIKRAKKLKNLKKSTVKSKSKCKTLSSLKQSGDSRRQSPVPTVKCLMAQEYSRKRFKICKKQKKTLGHFRKNHALNISNKSCLDNLESSTFSSVFSKYGSFSAIPSKGSQLDSQTFFNQSSLVGSVESSTAGQSIISVISKLGSKNNSNILGKGSQLDSPTSSNNLSRQSVTSVLSKMDNTSKVGA